MHLPISLQDIALSLSHKVCFEGFSAQIHYGSRIGIIGQNGSGKSTLLKMLLNEATPSAGLIKLPHNIDIGYVPQLIDNEDTLSGAQRFNQALTKALSMSPQVLMLDEPTNHLDMANRQSLMRMLKHFQGTVIMASHDVTLLQHCVDELWLIDNGKITACKGKYEDLMHEIALKRTAIERTLLILNRQKKDMHQALMKEQIRAAHSRAKGEKSIANRKWPTIVSDAKANRASTTASKKRLSITTKKEDLLTQMASLRLPEIICPTFSFTAHEVGERNLLSIRDANLGYCDKIVLQNVSLSVAGNEKVAIMGDNGSGKSTLVKAIMNHVAISKTGDWHCPKSEDIGYLDQHYLTLNPNKTVLQTIHDLVPSWHQTQIRLHLQDFLFKKNEEVNAFVKTLSGGEKARLALAQIAAKTPKLLILDEVSNNLDLTTQAHVIQVLQAYPAAMIVISHDQHFLSQINITQVYELEKGLLIRK